MTLAEQIRTLQMRGLTIENDADAILQLERISYFRLADYWRPLETNKVTHQFAEGSIFSEVVKYYNFDKELKVLLFTAIQTIEVAVRAKVIKYFSQTSGPFWFMDASNAINAVYFQSNLAHVRTEVARSLRSRTSKNISKNMIIQNYRLFGKRLRLYLLEHYLNSLAISLITDGISSFVESRTLVEMCKTE